MSRPARLGREGTAGIVLRCNQSTAPGRTQIYQEIIERGDGGGAMSKIHSLLELVDVESVAGEMHREFTNHRLSSSA